MKKNWIKTTSYNTLRALCVNCALFLYFANQSSATEKKDHSQTSISELNGLKAIAQSRKKKIGELKTANQLILARLREMEKEKEKTETYLYFLRKKGPMPDQLPEALLKEISILQESLKKALLLTKKIQSNLNKKPEAESQKDDGLQKSLSELDQILVSGLISGRFGSSPGDQGRVVSVNAQNAAVAISLGYRDGIKTGSRLNIYKGEEVLAEVSVIETGADISLAIVSKGEVTDVPVGASVKK